MRPRHSWSSDCTMYSNVKKMSHIIQKHTDLILGDRREVVLLKWICGQVEELLCWEIGIEDVSVL